MKKQILLTIILMMAGTSLASAKEVPPLQGVVNDYGKVLKALDKREIAHALEAQESKTSNQIVILTVDSLDGEVLEQFTIKVVEQWKLGQKGKDNGILIFQSVKDRKIRIEVGRGLEPTLTDAICSQIIRKEMTPKFQEKDFAGGYRAAIAAINLAVKGEYIVDEEAKLPKWVIVVVILILIVVFLWLGKNGAFSGGGSYSGGGSFSGGGGGYSGGGGSFGGGGASGSY